MHVDIYIRQKNIYTLYIYSQVGNREVGRQDDRADVSAAEPKCSEDNIFRL